MDRNLTEAANNGDVKKLSSLVEGDPLILLRATSLSEGDNPLHISCMRGHVDFVKEILNMHQDYAQELNRAGFSPLHIASASGKIEIVRELVKLGDSLCLIKGKEQSIPLHYAVVKGRVNVINELLSVCPDSVIEVTARQESCLHLAVKNNQFEAFKALCRHVVLFEKEYVLNMKDEHGNTILHLAASAKQYEVVHLLLDAKFGFKDYRLEVNIPNKMGLNPLDVLASEGGDSDIEEMLRLSGAVRMQETPQNTVVEGLSEQGRQLTISRPHSRYPFTEILEYLSHDRTKDSPGEIRNTLLVVAALIMTIMYQGVLSPPGGLWQEDSETHTAGKVVVGTINPRGYRIYSLFNSFGFFMSATMLFFLTDGFPLKIELTISIFSLVVTYSYCTFAIAPSAVDTKLYGILFLLMPMVVVSLSLLRNCKKRRPRKIELHNTGESV